MDTLYIVAAILVLVGLQSFLSDRFALRGLTYTRAFSRRKAFAGENVEMVEVLRNRKPLPVPWLRAESRMSAQFHFRAQAVEGALQETSDDSLFHRSVFFLRPFSQVTRRHAVTLKKRGYYQVGSVALTAGDLLGLSSATRTLETGAAITVYPRLLDGSELQIPSSRWQGDLLVKRWIVPDPFLIAGIREWQAGDAQRDVHWAATARTGRMQVKAHDYTANPKLFVILNVQRQEQQWGELMDYEQAMIEEGISLAATLCVRALSGGVEAGFAANAPAGPEDAVPVVLHPARYAGRDEDILEAMARIRVRRTKNFHTFLEDIGQMTGYDILILSAYESALIQERMAMLRLMGNSVALWPLGEVAA